MKMLRIIPLCFVLFAMLSCRETSAIFSGDAVARVGRVVLTREEVAAALPKGVAAADSVALAEAYVEKWVVRRLKLQEAELMFSSTAADIDRMVEEYRQSLLIRKIEQYYLDTDKSAEISEEEVERYYKAHKGEFKLKSPVVKGYVVAVPEQYRRREWMLASMRSTKAGAFKDVEQVCLKNNFRLNKFEEWTDVNDFVGYLPLVRSQKYDALIGKREVQQIHHNHTYYYFRVTDVLGVGDTTPLFMVRDNILRILTTRRQGELIRRQEQRMLEDAVQNGHATMDL
ncbi:MAG: peptidyl-prolyl cis-trans isomerase [Alistipes sp.]|nr:peptidyl-prolyl cis-trans isomerase [Alistipes sp.]